MYSVIAFFASLTVFKIIKYIFSCFNERQNLSIKTLSKALPLTPTVFKDLILATGVMKVYHHGFDS